MLIGGWGVGGDLDGVMPKRQSPDFRFREVGRSVIGLFKCCYSFSNEFFQCGDVCTMTNPNLEDH